MAPPLAYAEIEVGRDADACYRLLCDLTRVPEWVPGVARVAVLEADPAGRPRAAEFLSMPNRGSLAYRLDYEYDADARAIRWRSPAAEQRELVGEAVVSDLGGGRARVRYGVLAGAGSDVPVWAQAALRTESADTLARAFRRFAESA